MGTKNTLLAGLHLLFGIAGLLPFLFLFPAALLGMAWWGFVLRAANPPVPLALFLEGVGQTALQSFPDFPLGLAGLGLLALHFALSIPCLVAGMALLKGRPQSRGWIVRLGYLLLLAFPLGTALGLFTIASLARPAPVADRAAVDRPILADRMAAAFCYLIPILFPLFVIVTARDKAFQRLHAVQSLAFYLVFLVVAKLGDAFDALTGFGTSPFVTGAGILLLVFLAAMAFGGSRFKFPWVGEFAERWQGDVATMVDKAIDRLREESALAMHRAHLARAGAAGPAQALPKIEGTTGIHGFVQRTGRRLDGLGLVGGAILVFFIFALVVSAVSQVAVMGWSGINWAKVVPALLFSFAFGGVLLYMALRQVLSIHLNGAELAIARWPLRLGEETRARIRVTSRKGAKVERIAASLKCIETVGWRDRDNKSQNARIAVRDVPVPDMMPLAAADGSFNAEWILRVPRQAPPSFVGAGSAIGWVLSIDLQIAGAPDSTLAFEVLVLPEEAGG